MLTTHSLCPSQYETQLDSQYIDNPPNPPRKCGHLVLQKLRHATSLIQRLGYDSVCACVCVAARPLNPPSLASSDIRNQVTSCTKAETAVSIRLTITNLRIC